MEQKKFVKFGLTTENFRRYVGIITGEVEDYLSNTVFSNNVRSTRPTPPRPFPFLTPPLVSIDENEFPS